MSDQQEKLKAAEVAEGQKNVEDVENQAKTTNPEEVGKNFDKQQENIEEKKYSAEEYEALKKDVISNIIGRKLNREFLTVDPNNTEYQNKLFVDEDPLYVKAYIAYYNSQQLEAQLRDKPSKGLIDINKFMVNFTEEQEEKTKIIPQGGAFEKQEEFQKIGEFPVDPDHIAEIDKGVTKLINVGQYVDKLIITGNADATGISEKGKVRVKNSFIAYRDILISKGWTKRLPVEPQRDTNDQNVFNDGYAKTRALMQLAYLDKDQLSYLQENTGEIVRNLNAQPVGGKNIGDQFTGGSIDMEMKIGSTIIPPETKDNLLKMINNRTINYAVKMFPYRGAPAEQYYTVGTLHLGMTNGELSAGKVDRDYKTLLTRGHTFTGENKNKEVFLEPNKGVNTMRIIIDQNDPRINTTTGGMNNIQENVQSFSAILDEYAANNALDEDVKKYVTQTKDLLTVYEQVDQSINELKKVSIKEKTADAK